MNYSNMTKLFLGNLKIDIQKYLYKIFEYTKEKNPILIVPAVGEFTIIYCAIEAGYKRENIYTSDFSLYSSLLGYLFSGKSIDLLDFTINEEYIKDYEILTDEIDKVSYVIWLIKLSQMSKIHYQKLLYDDLLENKKKHIKNIKNQVLKMKDYFLGINYELKDLRKELVERNKNNLLIIDPPIIKNEYTKLFDFTDFIEFGNDIEEFDWKKEYIDMYKNSKLFAYPVIWYRTKDVEGFNEDEIIFAKEYDIDNVNYLLITKPDILNDFKFYKKVSSFTRKELVPSQYPVFNENDKITLNSKIEFITVPVFVALYYRDLFVHRLGSSGAEHYYIMLVDKKVFSICGFNTSQLFSLQSDKIYELFSMSVPNKIIFNPHRLYILCSTSKEFGIMIKNTASKINRFYTLNGIKTTCFSKYHIIKNHQGIYNRLNREKQTDGQYKIQAETNFKDITFKEAIDIWIKEGEKKLLINKKIKYD